MNKIKSSIIGLIVADAIGVPVEFEERSYLDENPVTDMLEYRIHYQPKGTWSDDSSMTLCTVENLITGYDPQKLSQLFIKWYSQDYWTAHDYVFDIGNTTMKAIRALINGQTYLKSGCSDKTSNGNGSLMRILPFSFYLKNENYNKIKEIVFEASSITHAHLLSKMSCLFYTILMIELIKGNDKNKSFENTITIIKTQENISKLKEFKRILQPNFKDNHRKDIRSSGFVIDTLEASIWCFLNNDSYKDCVLKAINLGDDTDTVGAICGGLAGYYYSDIPKEWIESISRLDDIENLCNKFVDSISK